MSLFASLAKLQKNAARAYVKLSQHFSGNDLIRDTWASMAQEMEHQAASLRALRPTFWTQLKAQEKALLSAIEETSSFVQHAVPKEPDGWSLHHCFKRALDFEDRLALAVYPPLIGLLRKEWTDQALDFYITVNAHLTHMARLVQSTSGDPLLVKKCGDLFQQFEKALLVPASEPAPPPKKSTAKKTARSARVSRRAPRKMIRTRVSTARRPKTSRTLAKRAKPLLKNIKLARRRVRR